MFFCGTDPGKTGAIAYFDEDGNFVSVDDFEDCLPNLIENSPLIKCAYLEQVSAMKGWKPSTCFSLGQNFGWWKGVFQTLGIPFNTIRPQEWQKGLFSKNGELSKKPNLAAARQRYPQAPLNLEKHHNRADAILIARVCYEREGRK